MLGLTSSDNSKTYVEVWLKIELVVLNFKLRYNLLFSVVRKAN